RTSTFALCNVTLPWAIQIVQHGIFDAAKRSRPIAEAINICEGKITNEPVAETFDLPFSPQFAA
ncbi:MAG: alanine dehydrogenase, partial [Pirellulales bacterium]|nr:alanine dehydrogenase [Pirellulales bacterium]